ncbi:MAG: hypothetical protein R3E21_08775 [Caenibius sp.]
MTSTCTWPCPDLSGQTAPEYALRYLHQRKGCLLVIPPLFDEANKLRYFLGSVMRLLNRAGIGSVMPDFPGVNESLQPLETQTLAHWQNCANAAATHFSATHVLTVRASAILAPPGLSGWRYAPLPAANALRTMLRARVVMSREAGREETQSRLAERGRVAGLELAGHHIGPQMFAEMESARLPDSGRLADVDQQTVGGSGLWLRAEPDHDPAQAEALAAVLAVGMAQ